MKQPKQRQLAPLISLKRLSKRSQSIRALINQAENRTSLEQSFNQILPNDLKNQFKVSSSEGATLVLYCHSAALMTKFRFTQNKILEQLNRRISPKHFTSIRVKVRPPSFGQKKTKQNNATHQNLSKKNAQLLISEAEHTNDAKLKEVLLRLANHRDTP